MERKRRGVGAGGGSGAKKRNVFLELCFEFFVFLRFPPSLYDNKDCSLGALGSGILYYGKDSRSKPLRFYRG